MVAISNPAPLAGACWDRVVIGDWDTDSPAALLSVAGQWVSLRKVSSFCVTDWTDDLEVLPKAVLECRNSETF